MIVLLLDGTNIVNSASVATYDDAERIRATGGYPEADAIMPLPDGHAWPFVLQEYEIVDGQIRRRVEPDPPTPPDLSTPPEPTTTIDDVIAALLGVQS